MGDKANLYIYIVFTAAFDKTGTKQNRLVEKFAGNSMVYLLNQ